MFSIILPVYNGEKFIKTAIESVLAQKFTSWELIIINDGSTDNTMEVISKYCDNPKIKIISQENGGVSSARNAGMENASYDYFAFIDADDLWRPNHLLVIYDMIKKYPHCGTYATLGEITFPNGKTLSNRSFFDNKELDDQVLYIEDFFAEYAKDKRAKTHNCTSSCITKAAKDKCGGFKNGCKIGEDLAFFLTAAAYYPVALSAKVTSSYEKGNSSATKDNSFDPDWFFFDDVNDILEDRTISEKTKKGIREVMQWFTIRRCRHYILDGRKKEARKAFREIGENKSLLKDKIITFGLLLLPVSLVKKLFMVRWRSKG